MFATLRWTGLMLVSLCLVGCGGGHKEFTPDEFATIKKGMPEADVLQLLGKPELVLDVGDVRRSFWTAQGKYYSMSFSAGAVNEPMVHADKQDYDLMIGFGKMAQEFEKKKGGAK